MLARGGAYTAEVVNQFVEDVMINRDALDAALASMETPDERRETERAWRDQSRREARQYDFPRPKELSDDDWYILRNASNDREKRSWTRDQHVRAGQLMEQYVDQIVAHIRATITPDTPYEG